MLPMVRFTLPDGTEAQVGPGGFVGRLANAALCIDHPRVSEAHALVSLRGTQLFLLALRGPLELDGRRVPHVRLAVGQRIRLVDELVLEVVELDLPDRVLAILGVAAGPVPLVQSAYTLWAGPPCRVESGHAPNGDGWIWSADGYRVRLAGQPPRALRPGDTLMLGDAILTVGEVSLREGGTRPTISANARDPALRIVARYETLHLYREDGAMFSIGGIPARIVSELVDYQVPVPWEVVARSIWTDKQDVYLLRQNWDRHLKRLRRKLTEAGFRPNLVRCDGRGNIELLTMPRDEVVDEG